MENAYLTLSRQLGDNVPVHWYSVSHAHFNC